VVRENLAGLAICASVARGDDGPYSDLELVAILREGPAGGSGTLHASRTDESLRADWTMKMAGQEFISKPRLSVLRGEILNHLYHHRGQLTVYLRLLDVALPQVYGPTADEPEMRPTS
jgi:hypothetical protein